MARNDVTGESASGDPVAPQAPSAGPETGAPWSHAQAPPAPAGIAQAGPEQQQGAAEGASGATATAPATGETAAAKAAKSARHRATSRGIMTGMARRALRSRRNPSPSLASEEVERDDPAGAFTPTAQPGGSETDGGASDGPPPISPAVLASRTASGGDTRRARRREVRGGASPCDGPPYLCDEEADPEAHPDREEGGYGCPPGRAGLLVDGVDRRRAGVVDQ